MPEYPAVHLDINLAASRVLMQADLCASCFTNIANEYRYIGFDARCVSY